MRRISLILSTVLSFIVSILTITAHRYIYGTFMVIVFVSALFALIVEFLNQTKK